MKTRSETLKIGVLSLAVQGALAAMCAIPMAVLAADDAVTALTNPTSTIEFGAANVSNSSAKFGEYNGLNKAGGYFIGNFNVQGGGDGAMRWGISATDLGTTSRALSGTLSNQGRWDLSLGYDELRHNISDTYQTPQQGNMGGNGFTLPATFGTFNAQVAPSARTLNAIQLGAFHTENVSSTRQNMSFGAGFHFSPQLSLKFDYNHLSQSGAKLQAFGNQGGVAIASGTGRAEAVAVLMTPTNYDTDTYNLALNWLGDKGHLTGGYYGSIFRDGYNSLSWQNPMLQTAGFVGCASGGNCAYQTDIASTMPSNQFHQLNLSGGYAFSSSTRLAGGLSYARNTQNDNYAPGAVMQAGIGVLPQSSLNGSVISQHADLKLTNQTTRDLVLSAGYKFNERDNNTSSNTYLYRNIANGAYTGVNLPYSNKKTQYELAADYRLFKNQNIRLAYEREDIRRWCDGVVGGAQCVSSPSSDENKLGLTYRLKASDALRLNAGYAYSKRDSNFDRLYSSNVGTYPEINGLDVVGFTSAVFVSRKQNVLKAGLSLQASDKLDLGLKGSYSKDNYDTVLGVQDGSTTGINLDATFSYRESGSVSAYASLQNRNRNMQNGGNGTVAVAPTQVWTNQLKEDGTSFGLTAKDAGLLGGKLEVVGDLSYTYDKSHYSTQVPYLATCGAAATLTCGSTPDINNKVMRFKLTGTFQVDKSSKVVIAYLYQKMTSNDYYYNAYEYGYTPNRVMPTNEQAPNYTVNMVGASYIYSFR